MNMNNYRRVKQYRKLNIESEKKLITQYLKYEDMLKQDVLYTSQRGARSASRLQNNKILSELLGYESYIGGRINIYFEGLEQSKTNGHEILESNSSDSCMICGEPLQKNQPYHRTDNCKKCNLYSNQGFGKNPWSFYEKGKVIEEKLNLYETIFEDEKLKLTAKLEVEESIRQNCCCRWREFKKKNDCTIDVYIKVPVLRPMIYVQNYSLYKLGNVEFVDDINPAHVTVLGWKRLPLNWGIPPLKVNTTQ